MVRHAGKAGVLTASDAPLAEAMQAGAPQLAGALAAIALFATANTVLIAMMAASRLLFGMARGGHAPPMATRTLTRRQTPAVAILLVAAGAVLCLPLGGVGLVGSVASLLALVTFAAVNLALLRLRRTRPAQARPFRVPLELRGLPLLPTLGLLVVGLLLTRFASRVCGIAGIGLILGFIVQALPWPPSPDVTHPPREGNA